MAMSRINATRNKWVPLGHESARFISIYNHTGDIIVNKASTLLFPNTTIRWYAFIPTISNIYVIRWYGPGSNTLEYEIVDVWDIDLNDLNNLLQNIEDEIKTKTG